ncbi:phage major capsid family protein [Mycobacteroides abscessus]|uniref:phage major capsid family protein n=1 Tax=Mycobacteroides abscessus TaxID=36809 RepID=UPI00092C3D3B|nr:phage major capsid protein [Mycobacteroides abscessus]MBE5440189.1 HK97 family phage major capsid protein [Mycobacteroides abscessus]SID45962.1 Phage capsid family [Mycobacteroides abscessus subsp. abscessus]SIG28055.1 Phage capsid family [Mycobacteroides abscessus subsp. abscessus]SIL96947.1 Phage capsid family [Mycobacteroides abscessus subsp. abscessus]SKU08450.1 Phage capsid family [Mycobacteroides abscessus subsp. abscessus]
MTVQSTDLLLPTQIADGIVEKAKTSSTIAALSAQEPQRFGKVEIITFDDDLTAEFVEEIAPKGSDEAKPDSVQAVPHKAVVQMRTSDEFKWADEDYKLNIFKKYEEKCARALARALDLGLYYRINPRTGNALTAWTNYLNATTKRVEITATSQPDLDFEVAAGLVIEDGYSVNGVAFDPKYAWKLATARFPDGRKKFPELGLGEGISSFEGVSAAVSSTVSGKAKDGDATDNKVRGILGNFRSGIRWGVQREFPFKILEYGDPDNKGRDLAGHNEILLRTEIVYGWYVFDSEFAVIEDAVTP